MRSRGRPACCSYPNLLIPVAEVGTDPLLATGSSHFAERFLDWFNSSFYGELASLEPGEGYVAPPLDGIWATAPYLHNASVPTLALLLDSTRRPAAFRRDRSPSAYDLDDVGWPYTESEPHSALPAAERKHVYGTSLPGYGNQGHPYGDGLTEEERDAVIAYLKTLSLTRQQAGKAERPSTTRSSRGVRASNRRWVEAQSLILPTASKHASRTG